MNSSLIIILTLLLFAKSLNTTSISYFISTFINYLQNNGIWEILVEIKKYYGTDVAIELCKEFAKSPHCEEVVRVYIYAPKVPITRSGTRNSDTSELMEFLEEKGYLKILENVDPFVIPKIREKFGVLPSKEV